MTCWPWSIPRGPRATLPTSTRTVSDSSKACEFHPSLSSTFNPRKELGFSELLEARERGGARSRRSSNFRARENPRSPARNREDTLTSSGGLKIKTNEAREAIGGITRKFWQIERPTFPDSSSYRIDLEAKKGEWKSGEEKLRKTRRRLIPRPFSRIHFSPLSSPPSFFSFAHLIVSLHPTLWKKKRKKEMGRGRFVDRRPFLTFLKLPWNLFARGSSRFLSSLDFSFLKSGLCDFLFWKTPILTGVDISFSNVFLQVEELKMQGAYK